MKDYERRFLSLFASLLLFNGINTRVNGLESNINNNGIDIEEIQEEDDEYVNIKSQNILDFLYKKYGKSNFKSFELLNIDEIELVNFKQEDLYELSLFPNISNLVLRNGVIEDSSFLNNLNNLSLFSIYNCQVNDLTCLRNTRLTKFDSGNSFLSNDIVNCLPNSLKYLRLYKESVINNLDLLPNVCPNIKDLSIIYCSGVVNLNFIKDLKYLEIIDALETPGCTEELLKYFKENNISTSLSIKDVENNKKLNSILNEIITDDMSDSEKIQNICVYIKKNLKKVLFDLSYFDKNNSKYMPLSALIENCKGISMSYSYLANSLFNMAGINSYDVNNDSNTWNIVEVDNKYYYIDIYDSNLVFLIDKFNVGTYYMQDPYNLLLSDMSKLDDIGLSNDLVNDIKLSNESKSFIEKYLSNFSLDILVGLILSVIGCSLYRNVKGKNNKKLEKK